MFISNIIDYKTILNIIYEIKIIMISGRTDSFVRLHFTVIYLYCIITIHMGYIIGVLERFYIDLRRNRNNNNTVYRRFSGYNIQYIRHNIQMEFNRV